MHRTELRLATDIYLAALLLGNVAFAPRLSSAQTLPAPTSTAKVAVDLPGRWRVTDSQVTASHSRQTSVARPERPRHNGKRRVRRRATVDERLGMNVPERREERLHARRHRLQETYQPRLAMCSLRPKQKHGLSQLHKRERSNSAWRGSGQGKAGLQGPWRVSNAGGQPGNDLEVKFIFLYL